MRFQNVPDHPCQYHLVRGKLDNQESWAHSNLTMVDCLQRWLQQILPFPRPLCKVSLPLIPWRHGVYFLFPCDLLWPVECGRCDAGWLLRLSLQRHGLNFHPPLDFWHHHSTSLANWMVRSHVEESRDTPANSQNQVLDMWMKSSRTLKFHWPIMWQQQHKWAQARLADEPWEVINCCCKATKFWVVYT